MLFVWTLPTLRRTPLRRTAQNFALSFPTPAPFSLFLSLSGCLLVEFWLLFLKAGALKCARLEFSNCCVKPRSAEGGWITNPPAGFGAAGVSHDNPRTPNVHIGVPRRFKHQQNSTGRHPESENGTGEGEKKTRNFGLLPFGAPPYNDQYN